MTISNVSFATASEVRETKPHVYLWMVRYANSGNSEDSDPAVVSSAFHQNAALNNKKGK